MKKYERRSVSKQAKADERFMDFMRKYMHPSLSPDYWTSKNDELIFCLLYLSYLIGKYQDDPSNHIDEK